MSSRGASHLRMPAPAAKSFRTLSDSPSVRRSPSPDPRSRATLSRPPTGALTALHHSPLIDVPQHVDVRPLIDRAHRNSDASWQTYLQKKPAVVRKKGPAAKREPASPRAKAKAKAGGGAMSEGIPKVCHICKGSGTAPAPAPQPAAVAPRDEEPYKRLASQAWFLASKVSAGVYEVDTYTAEICRGVPVMGARARGPLKKCGYREKMNLYTSESLVPIISDNHLLLHDTNLEDWKGAFTTYVRQRTLPASVSPLLT